MSMTFIPEQELDIDRDKSIDLLLASIAFEEFGLAHIIRAEAEKILSVLGTDRDEPSEAPELKDLLEINKSVERMLRKVIMKEMLLGFKLEDVIELLEKKGDDPDNNNGDDSD